MKSFSPTRLVLVMVLLLLLGMPAGMHAATLLGEYTFTNDRSTPTPTIYNSATSTYDATNNGSTLMATGGPGGGNYRSFDGNDSIKPLNFIGGLSAYSIAVWFQGTATTQKAIVGANGEYLLALSDLNQGGNGQSGTGVGQVRFAQYTGNWDTAIFSNSNTLNDGNWHFVAVTYDSAAGSNNILMYVDGALQTAKSTGSGAVDDSAAGFANEYIGASSTATANMFIGGLDDVRYYSGALTASEVQALYAAVVPEPGSLALAALGLMVVVLRRRR